MFRKIFRYIFRDPIDERLKSIERQLDRIECSLLPPEYSAQKAIASIEKIIKEEL